MFTVNSLNNFVSIYIKKLDIIKKTKKGLKKAHERYRDQSEEEKNKCVLY